MMQNIRAVATILIIALVVLFVIQNISMVTLSIFTIRVSMPLALLIVIVYLLGMMTGHTVVSFLRNISRR
ncbi:MAG: hypothetical protein KatS3mg110_3680 [Pirellulaceae bacterium]|nr:MAG: hypothetical protein KatS3mg110_3680 [Pirellulaceae bacterium]